MKIGIIGYGVVGGTTGEVLRQAHEVIAYDKFRGPYNSESQLAQIAHKAEVVFICVPTPMMRSGEIDYRPINDSLEALIEAMKKQMRPLEDILVVIRSTAVSGTADDLALHYKLRIAVNPEFLTERNALSDMRNTDRVVIGANDARSRAQLLAVYEPLFPNATFVVENRRTAEFIKYANNVMLALQIIFANLLKLGCKALGINYDTIAKALLLDPRIGRNIQVPGPDGYHGFGGKCFPKDWRAFTYLLRKLGVDTRLLDAGWELNLAVREKRDWENIDGAMSHDD